MKTAHMRVDEWIADAAFFFLVILTVLAAFDYVSILVLSGCFFFYIAIGILAACLLPHGRGMQKN
jgi:hypothetical protein